MMCLPSKLFFAALCCWSFTVVHIYGELVLLQYPADTNSRTQNYTCISNDDGAALTWIFPTEVVPVKDFKPKRPSSGNVRDCGIRGESTCLAKWDRTRDWRLVNSAVKPTGPVSDQRWEDFQEFGTPPGQKWIYQKVGVVNKPSSTVWFSGQVPKSGYCGVVICQREELHLGRCVRIYTSSDASNVWVRLDKYAPGVYNGDIRGTAWGGTKLLRTSGFGDPHSDEWETFRLDWNTQQKTIKMFRGNESEPFVQADIPPWDQVSAVGAYTGRTHRRLRFHFYDYYFTDTKNAVISTKRIQHSGNTFCAELLVGLCPKCKLNVTLVEEDDSEVETWPFSGDEHDTYSGLLAWRSVKMNTRFDSDIPRRLTLEIKTILNGDEGAGEWAIDNFRICQPGKELRESTITLASGTGASCQKLSYTESSTVNKSSSTLHETKVLSELQEFLRPRKGRLVGRGGLICNPSGCICDRGFTGSKCENECDHGFYGFSCMKTCGSCRNSEHCDKLTGFCEKGCQGNVIAPMCKTALVAPIVADVGLTTATVVLQGVELDEDEVTVDIVIQIRESGGESWVDFPAKLRDSAISSGHVAHITGLKPNTAYMVRAAASVETMNVTSTLLLTFGPEYNLTTCMDPEERNLIGIPYEKDLTVRPRDEERHIHNNLGHPYSVLVTDTLTGKVAFSAFGTSFPFNVTGLTPYTAYAVKIVDTITQCTLLDTRFHTFDPVPSEVQNFAVKSISDTDISLQWDPPAQENGRIKGYHVSLKLIEMKGCKDLNKRTPTEEEKVKIVNETTVVFDGLHPYAKYVVSVSAQTSKPGSPVTLSLETNHTVIPTSMVSTLRMSEDKGHVMWDKPADCTTITGPTEFTRLFVTRVSDSCTLIQKDVTAYSFYNLSDLHLELLSWYKVRVHVVRGYDEPENPDVYQELTWRANFDDVEAPTVVNVTDSTARIVQNVNYSGHAGKIFVTFILRELWSNESFALVATHTTGVEHELDVKSLKPNALYKVYTLVNILEFDRTATLNNSPILFKTKCLEPYFAVSPGEDDLTIYKPSRPQDCKHPANQEYSIKVYDIAENSLESSLGVARFPVRILDLNPDTEYEVQIWIGRRKERRLVFTTKVRTFASKESVSIPKAQLVPESLTTSSDGPEAQ